MRQLNVISFPAQPSDNDRLRLYREEPCSILVLAEFRARSSQPKRPALG
jgi:hypothetical protein